ncbi:MAG: type I-E CRISPR-associated protein Cse2/CasB [Methylococcus sp.]
MTTNSTPAPETESLWASIARLAGILSSEHFPTGDRAALKRMAPDQPPPLAFYRFAFRELPEGWEYRRPVWQTLIAGLALSGNHGNPHSPQRPLGKALAEQGYSEARLERLLAAEGDTLNTLLLRAARFLAAKAEAVDWTDAARLLLTYSDDAKEQIRREIAGDFYRNLKDKKD